MVGSATLERQLRSGFVICCALALAGAALVLVPGRVHEPLVGWLGLVFFGAAAVSLRARLLAPAVRVECDRFGVRAAGSGFGLIEWRDIEHASLWNACGVEWLSLRVSDPAKYSGRLPFAGQLEDALKPNLGRSCLVLDVSGVHGGAEVLLRRIEARIGQH